jgi:hypothetical protein
MKKLALDIDQLAVESFETQPDRARFGTVRGFDLTSTTCNQFICDCPTGSGESCQPDLCDTADCNSGYGHTCDAPSCFYSCPGTCGGDTCADTVCCIG